MLAQTFRLELAVEGLGKRIALWLARLREVERHSWNSDLFIVESVSWPSDHNLNLLAQNSPRFWVRVRRLMQARLRTNAYHQGKHHRLPEMMR